MLKSHEPTENEALNKTDVSSSYNNRNIMKSGIFDKNGIEIKVGDKIVFPYITPFGDLTEDEGFSKTVVFKYGCFGYETSIGFETLFSWVQTEKGDYIPNCGNKTIYTEKYPFWISK